MTIHGLRTYVHSFQKELTFSDPHPHQQKRRKIFNAAVPALSARERLRLALDECLKAVVNATDGTGPNARKRCELFNTLPPKKVRNHLRE